MKRVWLSVVVQISLVTGSCLDVARAGPASEQSTGAIPFKLLSGYAIQVEGRMGTREKLKFVIDTGSTDTFVDTALAKNLEARNETKRLVNMSKVVVVKRVQVPELQVGPMRVTDLWAYVADLSHVEASATHLDAIIGLDVLRREVFWIDYRVKRVHFSSRVDTKEVWSLEERQALPVIGIEVQGLPMHLVVDTGALDVELYADRLKTKIPEFQIQGRTEFSSTVSGQSSIRWGRVRHGLLGKKRCDFTILLVASPPEGFLPGVDGYLGVAALGVRHILFDFPNGQVGWTNN